MLLYHLSFAFLSCNGLSPLISSSLFPIKKVLSTFFFSWHFTMVLRIDTLSLTESSFITLVYLPQEESKTSCGNMGETVPLFTTRPEGVIFISCK